MIILHVILHSVVDICDFHIFKTSVEINFEKLLGHRVFKNHKIKIISNHVNLLQVCPSAPSFIFAVLFISSLKFVTDYFYSFTQFGCGYHCLYFDKFHHTFGWLENLCFCRKILCRAPLISQVQNNGFPSTFSEHSLVNINPSTGKKNWEFLVAFYVKWKSLLVDRLERWKHLLPNLCWLLTNQQLLSGCQT